MVIIVGLGNIGEQYRLTRHNVGFMFVDYIASYYDFPAFKQNFKSLISEKIINSEKVILQKPQTFMNLSGEAVSLIKGFYKLSSNDIIVIHDDIDLNFLEIRYKTNSGDGGQKGIKDIQNKIGKDIHKIKIGVGRPTHLDASSYVLSNFNKSEIKNIEETFYKWSLELDHIISKDFSKFIQNINNK